MIPYFPLEKFLNGIHPILTKPLIRQAMAVKALCRKPALGVGPVWGDPEVARLAGMARVHGHARLYLRASGPARSVAHRGAIAGRLPGVAWRPVGDPRGQQERGHI